jgi:Zn-dependent peptidase ImmA (M78 family)
MTLVGLYAKAEQEGIEVDDFQMREVVSASFPENWIAIDTKRIKTRKEEKVILAHEIGHCETGSFYNVYSPCDIRAKHEYRANKRTYQILVPHDDLIDAVDKGITETWDLAEYFDVPCEFMVKAIEYWQRVDQAG